MTNTIVDLTPILEIVIMLVVTIITSFLIPWIKAKTTQEQWCMIQDIAKIGTTAAEILFKGSGRGQEKLSYVMTYIKEFCLQKGFSFDDKTIRQAIENAVKNMNDNTVIEYKPEISE